MTAPDVTGLVETGAEAAYAAQNVIPGSAYTFPRSAARTTACAVLAAVLPKLADEIEGDEDYMPSDAYIAARLRSLAERLGQ